MLTYRSIQPYLVAQCIDNDHLYCTFEIEEERFESSAAIVAVSEPTELAKLVVSPSKVRFMLGRLLRRNLGKNKILDAQKEAPHTTHTVAELEQAAVVAFEQITDQLVFMETTEKWHLATQFSDFEVFLRQNPLRERYDKKIMAQMLVEMTRADGRITKEERLFFKHFLNEETGRLSQLLQAPTLTEQDLAKVSVEGRATVFLVVAAAALADHSIQAEEQEKLDYLAAQFGLTSTRQQALTDMAAAYTKG